MEASRSWDFWVEEAVRKLESLKLLRSLTPIYLRNEQLDPIQSETQLGFEVFDEMRQWDRSAVEVTILESTFKALVQDIPSSGSDASNRDGGADDTAGSVTGRYKKLLLFSSNDYLGLSSHPTIKNAAAKAAQEHGMGPRGSPLVCGYTNYHRLLELCLADLKKQEDCLLCPTGYAANMAVMVTLGRIGSLLAAGNKPLKSERIAIFSDALNHASIIDGIIHSARQQTVEVFKYRHCDMAHLDALLLSCTMERKVVVTDSLFSMDGDFAPLVELVELRKRHGFLLVIDDAHGTFVCGKTGGGVAEEFSCEEDIDICIGTLSKAAGCHGGFIACKKRMKQLILSSGRSYIFSTATPVPVAAAAHAAVIVAKKETWRRREVWNRVQEFRDLTGIPIASPIISLIVGSEEKALQTSRFPSLFPEKNMGEIGILRHNSISKLLFTTSPICGWWDPHNNKLNNSYWIKINVGLTTHHTQMRHLLEFGFHVIAIRPPTVPPNSCRLRVTLCASHTAEDLKKLVAALSFCINFQHFGRHSSNGYARL